MRFKTDENIHPDLAERLRRCGYDVHTILSERLQGRIDADIAAICQQESRTLITFDKGFGDIRAYPPEAYSGLIVLRLRSEDRRHLLAVFERVIPLFQKHSVAQSLWIVDDAEVRIRGSQFRNA